MSDYKEKYSEESNDYIENDVSSNEQDLERYKRSKDREQRFNENWEEQKVNLNDIVNAFIPTQEEMIVRTEGGVKYNFEGERYSIKCDKVAGYLRIYDKRLKKFCLPDGTACSNNEKTHFKIKRR